MSHRLRHVTVVLAKLLLGETARRVGFRRARHAGRYEDPARQRARAVRRALEELGPFYVKLGQMLSTRPDIVSEVMISELERLHERVTVAPFETFEPVFRDELGPSWRDFFAEIDHEPLGTGSLAQVYWVRLANGKPAVVKVQRPGIQQLMHEDWALLRRAARILAKRAPYFNAVIDLDAMLETLFDAMEPELDFTVEARNMDDAREAVSRFKNLAVPDVIHKTPRVLIESIASGVSIHDVKRDDFSREQREAIGRDVLSFMFYGYFVDHCFHADPHPGNIFLEPGEPAYLIDWGMVGRVDRRMSLTMILILLGISQSDGVGLAKAWIELGRATSWADIPAFVADMTRFVPKVGGVTKTMEELNFGVSLTQVMKYATRRGIQTSPAIALLAKSFANTEGSIRAIAPELSMVDVFEEVLEDCLLELAAENLSKEQAAHNVIEMMIGSTLVTEQVRTALRDMSNRELTVQVNQVGSTRSRVEDRADARAAANRRTMIGLAVLALWWNHRRAAHSK
jgi:ubiquinone biosynthesis protein